MFSKEELMRRLANGESMDAIVQEVTDVLNEAVAEQAATQAKEQKREDWAEAWRALKTVIRNHYPKTAKYFADAGLTEDDEDELVDAMINTMDEVEDEIDSLSAMLPMFTAMRMKPTPVVKKASKDDDILSKWIKTIS
jgi:vacuolar-type H+-ATPase subunit I/STV1